MEKRYDGKKNRQCHESHERGQVWVILAMGVGLMIVNIVTMVNMYSVIETMWLEIQQVKETNVGLYQFIEEHRNDFD